MLLGGTAITLPASTNHSLSLNGIDGYVTVPNSSSLNITGPITLEAWIKTNSGTAQQGILERYRTLGVGTSDGGYGLRLSDGKLMFFTAKNGYEFDAVFGASVVTPGGWHHVAGVFDGVQLRVYLDGVLDGAKASTFSPGTGTNSLKLGARGDDATLPFNGLIDEARVTATAVYTTPFIPSPASTALPATRGLWTFDDQTANDSSGNGNNGMLLGGATVPAN